MRFVCDYAVQPEWPEIGYLHKDHGGAQVVLRSVAKAVEEGKLGEDAALNIWFPAAYPDGTVYTVYPWKNAGYMVNDDGTPATFGATGPLMTSDELVSLGMTDDELEAERRRLFGDPEAGSPKLGGRAPQTIALEAYRYKVYGAVIAKWSDR